MQLFFSDRQLQQRKKKSDLKRRANRAKPKKTGEGEQQLLYGISGNNKVAEEKWKGKGKRIKLTGWWQPLQIQPILISPIVNN